MALVNRTLRLFAFVLICVSCSQLVSGEWIISAAINGRTCTVRITWADSSSPFYKGKGVDFIDDEFKKLGNLSVKAAVQGYK